MLSNTRLRWDVTDQPEWVCLSGRNLPTSYHVVETSVRRPTRLAIYERHAVAAVALRADDGREAAFAISASEQG